MKTLRRTTIVALVMALVAIPTAAFASSDATTETDQAVTDRETDRVVTDRSDVERPDRDLRLIKARALEAIDRQLDALARLRSAIANAEHITEAHADQLLSDIARTAEELKSLARQIEAATTLEELRGLIEKIDDFQIGHVLAPKTHQVIASDSLVYASGKLERYSEKLTDIIARFEEAGFEVGEAWRLLDEMNSNITEGYRLASPVAGNVIGLQPGDWPDPAQAILAAGGADLRAAGHNLRAAHGNGADIVSFLRSLVDGTDFATDVARTDGAVTDAPPSD